ncbi:unnamed protein product [Mytilus coruscus]|uniref:Reverse transcriptase domain-containing protein n=1 Tax=Mytilus coruscus TaxID=42192 RepID=A0A6J8A669_MYTCO|nr:unnamed protein product [Mytilus coruscus]
MEGIKKSLADNLTEFQNARSSDINTMWNDFKNIVKNVMTTYVPTKQTKERYSHPWMNTQLRKISNSKQRACTKAKRTKHTKDWKRYKFLKAKLKKESRVPHGKYTEDIISTDKHKEKPKRFWSYIKSRKRESTGIVTLKDKECLLHSDTPTKASILNHQFQSVYTKEDTHNIPHMGPSPFPTMDNIKEAELISPYLTILYQKALDTGTIPNDCRAANIVPVFKKGENTKLQTTDQSH